MNKHFFKSYLEPELHSFTVVSDLHFMLPGSEGMTEFPNRALQSDRANTALRLAADLEGTLTLHLGDFTQEYCESANYAEALRYALESIRRNGVELHSIPGNQDVGDKPDPCMPARPPNDITLQAFESSVGPLWRKVVHSDTALFLVNSQILTAGLPRAEEQREWIESEFLNAKEPRKLLFLHLPLFLASPDEPSEGHYDNVSRAERHWLLDLCDRAGVELAMSGHVHWRFFNRFAGMRYFIAPSPAFTRPSFGCVFKSAPAAQRGRDDRPKLGFFHVRRVGERHDLHLVRTEGWTKLPDELDGGGWRQMMTRPPLGLPASPLGISLIHPLAEQFLLPEAWPSSIRAPVRNDYPLLALMELGVRHLRTSWHDIESPLLSERLAVASQEGIQVTLTLLATDLLEFEAAELPAWVDGIELQVPASRVSELDALAERAGRIARQFGCHLTLSLIDPGHLVKGKQHRRTRLGFSLDEALSLPQSVVGRADFFSICAESAGDLPAIIEKWTAADRAAPALALQLSFSEDSDEGTLQTVTLAMMAVAVLKNCRIYFGPLQDMDRTMDTTQALLDGLCNPHPAFHALRSVNTVLFSNRKPGEYQTEGRYLKSKDGQCKLELDRPTAMLRIEEARMGTGIHQLDLKQGWIREEPSAAAEV